MKNKIIISTLVVLSLAACSADLDKKQSASSTDSTQGIKSEQLTDGLQSDNLTLAYKEATKTLFQARVLYATLYGLPEEQVGQYYADQMEIYSPQRERLLREELTKLSDRISQLPLLVDDQISKDNQQIMVNLTRYFAGSPDFSVGYIDPWMGLSPFIVNQINGPLIDIPRYMQSDQSISNQQDAEDYIARLDQFDELVDSVQEKLIKDAETGWIAPKVNLKGAIGYFKSFTEATPAEHPLVKTFADKLKKVTNMSEQVKQDFIKQATHKVSTVVYPAYQTIAKQTKNLTDRARNDSGIWAQPDGKIFYQDAIRQLGDSELTAEEIHQLGINEVSRISSEMNIILKANGYAEGSVGQRMMMIGEEPRFLYPDSDSGRSELLADLNGYIEEINMKMGELFKTVPPYDVEVRAFPVEIQEGASGGQYTPPSVDGSKPGIYWINLRDMKANPKFSLKTLTFHEANPGHHWQVSLNLAQQELPFLRRIAPYNAYTEGWALYAEKVAEEMGLYQNDPFSNLGRLQAELFRAVRLVVDTGLHHKRWSRERAIQYMREMTGSAESDVTSEIERYMAWPGQALGYKLGMLKILALREKSRKVLANRFDLAEFHDLILLGGAVPMKLLEQRVDFWIEKKAR